MITMKKRLRMKKTKMITSNDGILLYLYAGEVFKTFKFKVIKEVQDFLKNIKNNKEFRDEIVYTILN